MKKITDLLKRQSIDSIREWIKKRKKWILIAVTLIICFFLFWTLNLGSITAFLIAYFWSFHWLVEKLGFDPWLARGILIPTLAAVIYSISLMISIRNKQRRRIGTILLITILTITTFSMYFYTKDAVDSEDFFNRYSGEPLKRYYKTEDNKYEIFPKTMKYHPDIGVKLEVLTRKVASEMHKDREWSIKNMRYYVIEAFHMWTETDFQIKKGEIYQIKSNRKVSPDGSDWVDANGSSKSSWVNNYNVIPGKGHCGLIAMIEDSSPFFVGKEYKFRADISGNLFLGINDADCRNNRGYFIVMVKRLN